jgi:hypothetical protein
MLESIQEKIVASSSLFALLVAVIFFSIRNEVYTSLYITVMSLGSIFLTVYNLNCVLNGGCAAWSWILTLLVAGSAVMTVYMYGHYIDLQLKGNIANDDSAPLSRRVVVLNAGTDY